MISGSAKFLTIRKEENDISMYQFLVYDARSLESIYALSAAMRIPMGKENQLREVGDNIHATILNKIKPDVEKVHLLDQRCLVVINLTNFPILLAYVDTRDQCEVMPDDDTFSKTVRETWLKYDLSTQVPTIYGNLHVPFTGIKMTNFKDLF